MSDIVERLRRKIVAGQPVFPSPLDHEAADEIERLRGLLKRACNLLPLIPRDAGTDLAREVAAVMAGEKATDQPEPVQRGMSQNEYDKAVAAYYAADKSSAVDRPA